MSSVALARRCARRESDLARASGPCAQIARSVVVLPAPLAPSSAVIAACLEREVDAVQRLGRPVDRVRAALTSSSAAIRRCVPR